MKRYGNLYEKVYSVERLLEVDVNARKGKGDRADIKRHDANRESNINNLCSMLQNRTYKTSNYKTFKVFEPKERDVCMLPYYPDRITQHFLVVNVLEPCLVPTFTSDSYSCIKGRGTHAAYEAVLLAMKDEENTRFCLKMDIRKFYPSIDHDVLKVLLRRKFKDDGLLWLMDEIIDSTPGLPIGNYTSQYFANFYLNGFDHWLKEVKKVRYYFRYADDMIILASTSQELHQLRVEIQNYLREYLRLELKHNYQVFPVAKRGIDFVGYVIFPTHVRIRKRIKQNCARKMKKSKNPATIASYKGLFKHANCTNLTKKLFNEKF